MRKWLIPSVLAVAALAATPDRAAAYGAIVRPYYTAAAFPYLNPPGYYTNSYYYAWYYPWYAYYNASHGPYANWQQWGGYATYGGACGPHGCGYAGAGGYDAHGHAPGAAMSPGSVCVTLPADAKLLFNGTAADGSGTTRTFGTPPLAPGQEYAYDLTAEVVRDGRVQTVTERVTVRAGAETKVTLAPAAATRTAGR